jgi:hypothetical protein
MPVTIENPQSLPLTVNEQRVLKVMFADYHRLVVRSRLAGGLSGSGVYLVRPILKDGAELPSVVKIDLYERIEQEWNAYRSYVRNRLYKVAEIRGEPVNPPGSPLSGLWYPFAGAGIDKITSLYQYLIDTPPDKIVPLLEKHLFKYFAEWWRQTENHFDFNFRAAYDDFLPLNLTITCTEAKGMTDQLFPESIDEQEWRIGEYVQVSGFKVVKLLREKQGLSLDVPESHKAFRIHVYGVGDVSAYEIGQVVQRPFTGLITETRQRQLVQQAQKAVGPEMDLRAGVLTLPDGRMLPNPLLNWQKMLRQSMDVKVACIHGDLNMENVLVDRDTETVHLIDFAKSRKDHVLRDLLHLEMAVVNKILSETMTEGEQAAAIIHDLYQRLHCAVVQGKEVAPPTGQMKVFTILQAIRQAARPLLYRPDNWQEYYNGLFIYLLGSLRFRDLDRLTTAPRPKQLAFWGAATILDLMENEPDCSAFVSGKTVIVPGVVSSWDIDKITAEWEADPLTQRLIFFNILKTQFSLEELGELAHNLGLSLDDLPPGSRGVKAQELIGYFERRGQKRNLLEAAAKARKDIPWR